MCEPAETVLTIQVSPRSGRDRHEVIEGDVVRVWLAAPPVQGAANKALIRYLGTSLGLAPSSVTVVGGQTSRTKRVRVPLAGSAAIGILSGRGTRKS